MARIESLLIHGIRSFGSEPKDVQVIHFKSPLTLILGRNGCGKTTIIEALKYITTGELPFGQGAAFVHDPKLAREMEVRGQVKVELKSAEKKFLTVTRTLQATQKAKKLEVATVDVSLQVRDPVTNQKESLPQKCASVNELMVQTLGVSKPIISNVIFCHQEDSSWPLEEGKKLKERFDEIFDSTKHNRCLEEIRKLRKTVLEETRTYKLELSHFKEKREMVIQKRIHLEDVRRRYSETTDKIKELNDSLDPIEKEFELWSAKQQNYAQVQSAREKKKALYGSLVEQQLQLEQSIQELHVGSKEDLETALSDFKLQKQSNVMTKETLEKQISRYRSNDDDLMKSISESMNRRGELQAEVSQQEERISQRNEKLKRLCRACGLTGINESPTEYDIDICVNRVKDSITELDHKLAVSRRQHDDDEKRLQGDLDAKRVKLCKLEQDVKNKEDSIETARYDIKDKESKLHEVDSSANRLVEVQDEIELFRAELEHVRESVDEDSLRKEIVEHKEACKRLEEKQTAVNNEVKRLLTHSSNLNKLAELEKQEASFSATLRKLRNKNEEGINRLLSNCPDGSLKYELQNRLRTLEQKIKRDTQQITARQRDISGLTEQRRHKREQLNEYEKEVSAANEKIYGLCGRKPLETVISEEEEKLQALQDEVGMLSSSDKLYKRYISKLRQKNPCCPLCERGFDTEQDAVTVIQELNSKIVSLPAKIEEDKEKAQISKTKLSNLLQMRSTDQRMRNLQENIIPALKAELSSLERDLDSKEEDLAVLQASLLTPQEDEALGRTMLADVAVMDQVHSDLKKVTSQMETIKKALPSGGVSRNVEEAQAENDVLRDELAHHRASREEVEAKLHKHRDAVNSLEQEINRKVTEQLKIKSLVQQRVQLEERLSELSATVAVMEQELDELRRQLRPARTDMMAAEETLQAARRSHRAYFEEQSEEIARKKSALDEVSNLQMEITAKEQGRIKDQLEEEEEKITLLEKQREEFKKRIADLDARLKTVIQEIADFQNKERDLHDNLQLHLKREEAVRVKREVDQLKEEMGSLNLKEIMAKLNNLAEQTSRISVLKNKAEGSCAELKANLEEKQRELEQDTFRLAEDKYKNKFLELKIHEIVEEDLQKFYVAYDIAMMEFHKKKMEQINGLIRELWQQIYRGNDIDYIEIRTDETKLSVTAQAEKRRIYNYRVVQIKNSTEMDMRGRCSAGQKVLASLIIRMALAETFSLKCGILTLDEPTTNLDEENIASLSAAILEIVEQRLMNENFQLVVITHDVNFLKMLTQAEFISHYYEVYRNHQGKSVIKMCDLEDR